MPPCRRKYYFLILSALSLPAVAFSLDQKPWFGDVYEFRADTGFTYSYFNKVQGAVKQPSGASNNYLAFGGFGFTPSESIDVDLDIEMARTPRQNFSFRSGAVQARYRFLDDVAGDPVSIVAGFSMRGVGSKSVKDISSPYASYANFELSTAVGKEHTLGPSWSMRGYGFAALGLAVHGYPWVRVYGLFEGKSTDDTHRGGLFTEGYFGFGRKNHLNVDHFHGWGNIQHDSIDIGTFYGYKFGLWGILAIAYSCRVFAHNYPEYEQKATLRYEIPFSLL